jgi:hypothetical protein
MLDNAVQRISRKYSQGCKEWFENITDIVLDRIMYAAAADDDG